jgi:hypothetical protein
MLLVLYKVEEYWGWILILLWMEGVGCLNGDGNGMGDGKLEGKVKVGK